MATFTNVLLNCQTASYGEIFNVVDYILLAPLQGQGTYYAFDQAGRPRATIYVHLRVGGAQGAPAGQTAQQMIFHQCRLAQFAIITRTIRDLASTDYMDNGRGTYVSVASAGLQGPTASYNAVLYKNAGTVFEDSVGAQSHSIRALEAAHHAMATVVNAVDNQAAARVGGRRDLGQLTADALNGVTDLARGSVIIDFNGQRAGVQYIITGGNAAANNIPQNVVQVDINGMSDIVAATIRRQAFLSRGADAEWWGGLPRMFHEFVRIQAAIAPQSPDSQIGSNAFRGAAQQAVVAANGLPTAANIRTFWAQPPAQGAATATILLSAADPNPANPAALWGAGLYIADPDWTLQSNWGTGAALNLAVLRRDAAPGRNWPHLVNPPPQQTPPHADEVLATLRARANLAGIGAVESDGGLPEYRQDSASRRATPPWIAAAVAMIRFFGLPANTLVVGRRSSILEAAYVAGIGVYVIGDGTPAALVRDWNPIFTEETEQVPSPVLAGNNPVPIGTWRRPRAAGYAYLSTAHRDLAYRILNNAARPGNVAAPHLYPVAGLNYLGGADDFLISDLATGNNNLTIEVTAAIV